MNCGVMFRYACCVGLVGLFVTAGCGDSGPTRCMTTGTVTLDGQPVETGQILFLPADGQGPSDACQIVAGEFKGEVAPGSKRVEITASKETPASEPGGMPNSVSLIPKQYNSETTLTAEVKDGQEPMTFDLEGK